jgi:hypothetical protein
MEGFLASTPLREAISISNEREIGEEVIHSEGPPDRLLVGAIE